jgi:hypothetical protein
VRFVLKGDSSLIYNSSYYRYNRIFFTHFEYRVHENVFLHILGITSHLNPGCVDASNSLFSSLLFILVYPYLLLDKFHSRYWNTLN